MVVVEVWILEAADCDEKLERATRPVVVVVQEEENHGDTAADMCRGAGGRKESRRAAKERKTVRDIMMGT